MSSSTDPAQNRAASNADSAIRRIGVIGLGHMGSDFAGNLIADGYQVTVFDLNEKHIAALRSHWSRVNKDGLQYGGGSEQPEACGQPVPRRVPAIVSIVALVLRRSDTTIAVFRARPQSTDGDARDSVT
jgi:6-phosphogluconate dehydrogenase (decarboxylating)